jgi:hypothetical protein
MKAIRQIHLYLGTFFAPTITFFALTGAVQTFGLHEDARDGSYHAPTWLSMLAEIHKDQSLEKPHRGPPPGVAPGRTSSGAPGAPRKAQASLPLKVFVAFMAIGLIVAATLGIYIAFKNIRARKLTWTLLVLGTALPVALLFL